MIAAKDVNLVAVASGRYENALMGYSQAMAEHVGMPSSEAAQMIVDNQAKMNGETFADVTRRARRAHSDGEYPPEPYLEAMDYKLDGMAKYADAEIDEAKKREFERERYLEQIGEELTFSEAHDHEDDFGR